MIWIFLLPLFSCDIRQVDHPKSLYINACLVMTSLTEHFALESNTNIYMYTEYWGFEVALGDSGYLIGI